MKNTIIIETKRELRCISLDKVNLINLYKKGDKRKRCDLIVSVDGKENSFLTIETEGCDEPRRSNPFIVSSDMFDESTNTILAYAKLHGWVVSSSHRGEFYALMCINTNNMVSFTSRRNGFELVFDNGFHYLAEPSPNSWFMPNEMCATDTLSLAIRSLAEVSKVSLLSKITTERETNL